MTSQVLTLSYVSLVWSEVGYIATGTRILYMYFLVAETENCKIPKSVTFETVFSNSNDFDNLHSFCE